MKANDLTLIGVVAGRTFYEHPRLGDEAPLQILVSEDGNVRLEETPWWDLPDREEVEDYWGER